VAPGAVVGAVLLPFVPDVIMKSVISVIALYSGINTFKVSFQNLREEAREKQETSDSLNVSMQPTPSADDKLAEKVAAPQVTAAGEDVPTELTRFEGMHRVALVCIGVVIGVCSVLTGTGGPFIMLPIMFMAYPNVPAAEFVSISQAVSIVISVCSTTVSLLKPDTVVDLGFTACAACCMLLGIPFGAHIGAIVRSDVLKVFVAGFLIVVAIYMVVKVILEIVSGSHEDEIPVEQEGLGQMIAEIALQRILHLFW